MRVMFARGSLVSLCAAQRSMAESSVYISRCVMSFPCVRKLEGEGCVRASLGTLVPSVVSRGCEDIIWPFICRLHGYSREAGMVEHPRQCNDPLSLTRGGMSAGARLVCWGGETNGIGLRRRCMYMNRTDGPPQTRPLRAPAADEH